VIRAFRLSSLKYPGSSGLGAAIRGGRWNPKSIEAIYAAGSPSLAALEILVHFAVLPVGYGITIIDIPDALVEVVADNDLPADWEALAPRASTQSFGRRWVAAQRSAVLSVPSAIMPAERNYVINPKHPDFAEIVFSASQPFRFDPRLK
jgi:RES domain-containing protein